MICRTNPHARKGILKCIPNVWTIEYLPVLQIAAPAQPNPAGAYPAKRTGNAGKLATCVNAGK
jgi:hypothetical protein